MSKRARRLAKKDEFRAVEEAIGVSLGRKPAEPKDSKALAEGQVPARGRELASAAREKRRAGQKN